ncbi:Pheromone-processing carboxypeptidase KEX1 [Zancudomyces culisetae]|uniref:Pheromone-processing carboxypeptidase KEX1 n=1 Tax=Zancudomyces culisetae TaxID=1213189 RepID=A0A1R1PYZ0_ZANCU|nr:Pheromone-processing carboxypeptidase KEX1 [Zancudomyces culisetae]|eukprot:OMH86163.1 Pheromone-processing carboxypeptidase KEX1 [Zancudomyces culisetae]
MENIDFEQEIQKLEEENLEKSWDSRDDYLVKKLYQADQYPKFKELDNYAGHLKIEDDKDMFFWLIRNNTKTQKELVIWLNGGPGCSSFDGLFLEVGPFDFDLKGQIVMREYSWVNRVDVLFIDQPIGAGFSFGTSPSTYDEGSADLENFIEKFYELFPEYHTYKLYITGESIAGTYIVKIAQRMLRSNRIPIEGLLIGNGLIDPKTTYLSYLPFLESNGLINGTALSMMKERQQECAFGYETYKYKKIKVSQCENVLNVLSDYQMIGGDTSKCLNIYDYRLIESRPACGADWPPNLTYLKSYINQPIVKSQLNMVKSKQNLWVECNTDVYRTYSADLTSDAAIYALPEVIEKIKQVVLFAGDKDIVCNTLAHEYMIGNMTFLGGTGFSRHMENYLDWKVNGKSTGRFNSERGLTYIEIYNASHMPAVDNPLAMLDILSFFEDIDDYSLQGMYDSNVKRQLRLSHTNNDTPEKSSGASLILLLVVLISAAMIMAARYISSMKIKSQTQWQPVVDREEQEVYILEDLEDTRNDDDDRKIEDRV